MRQTNWDGKEVLLVEVPERGENLTINGTDFGYQLLNHSIENGAYWNEGLPPGDWQFAFASPLSPTEEEAGEWVASIFYYLVLYRNYMAIEDGQEYELYNAIDCLHSRIKSEGFPHPERVVLLTKK